MTDEEAKKTIKIIHNTQVLKHLKENVHKDDENEVEALQFALDAIAAEQNRRSVRSEDVQREIETLESLNGVLQYALIESDSDLTVKIPDYQKSLNTAITALEAYQPWVSVEDRLPTENQYRDARTRELIPLLVCLEYTDYPFRAFYDGKNWGDGIDALYVTSWMPLPQPPKGESNG